jgi:hypothetical protein
VSRVVMLFGENGRKSGLALGRSGDVELRILVLPKTWKTHEPRLIRTTLRNESGTAVSLVAFEGDRCELQAPNTEEQESLWPALVRCWEGIAIKADEKRTSLVRPVATAACTLTFEDAISDDTSLVEGWRDYRWLWWRAVTSRKQHRVLQDWTRQLSEMTALASSQTLLAPLLRDCFVQTIDRLVHEVRPGYVRRKVSAAFVRGSVDVLSAAMAAKGGTSVVICTCDEFVPDTPLMQVIKAALRIVATCVENGGRGMFPETPVAARWLLGRLEGVRDITLSQARFLGKALGNRLPRTEGDWRHALRLAVLVLDDQGLEPLPDAQQGGFGWHATETQSYVFDVNTAPMWERIIRKSWIERAVKGRRLPAWDPQVGRGMQCDIVPRRTRSSPKRIAEVKYVAAKGAAPTEVQRQAFTYSHVYEADDVSLVYVHVDWPQGTSAHKKTGPRVWWKPKSVRLPPGSTSVFLRQIKAEFPARQDVRTSVAFKRYRRRLRRKLKKAMSK